MQSIYEDNTYANILFAIPIETKLYQDIRCLTDLSLK